MKKKLLFKLLVFAVITAFVTVTSCKDYDDDISNLEKQIAGLSTTLGDIKAKVDAGAVITSVTSTADGLTVVTDKGTYNLTNGKDGAAGAAGATGAKGDKGDKGDAGAAGAPGWVYDVRPASETDATYYWWVDKGDGFVITDYKAQGPKGDQGEQGETGLTGPQGPAGKDGVWYVPDVDETWHKWAYNAQGVAEDQGSTGVEWLPEGTITAVKNGNGDVTFSNVKGLNGATTFTIFNSKILRSLTFIPDFTSPDGTPQMAVHFLGEWYKPAANVQNWDPNHNYDVLLTPYKGITYAKFHVSPSNATLEDFEVVGLLHKTSEILWRSTEEPLLKAVVEDATVENGILTVPILVHADLYDRDDFTWGSGNGPMPVSTRATPDDDEELLFIPSLYWYGENISVALQVKIKNMDEDDTEERKVVSTEYVRAQLSLLFARIEIIKENGEVGEWGNILPSHMADDIDTYGYYKESASIKLWNGWNADNKTYNKDYSINLNDSLQAIAEYNDTWRVLEDFGYDDIEKHFVFELVDNPNEGVDQSNRYVTLDKGVIKVKPTAAGGPNTAAEGRTPVVLAKVVDKAGNVYAAGYLKIVITKEADETPVVFNFNLDDFVLNCAEEYEFTEGNQAVADLDQIFNHSRITLGKDDFFREYFGGPIRIDWDESEVPDAFTNDMRYMLRFATNTWYTQSGMLKNYIAAYISKRAPEGEYKIKTYMNSLTGNMPDINIYWTFEVKLPEDISLTANPAFLSEGIYKIEPTVWRQDPQPKSSTPYEGFLTNAFMHNENDFNFGILQDDQKCDDYLTPYFVFTKVPAGFYYKNDDTPSGTFEVYRTGTDELAAKIIRDVNGGGFFIYLNDQTSGLTQVGNFKPLSDAAKDLVAAGWVEVQPRAYINGATYNVIDLYDAFKVTFTYPLKFNFADNYNVYDQGTMNMNKVTFNIVGAPRAVFVKDFLNNDIVFGNNHYFSTPLLVNHYEIANTNYVPHIKFDVENITTNLPNGTFPEGMRMKLSSESIQVGDYYSKLVLEWSNATGGSVQAPFEIYIPVSLKHKWGELGVEEGNVIEEFVTITVNPGTGL